MDMTNTTNELTKTNYSYISNLFTMIEVGRYIGIKCMHYVVYNL